MQRSEILLILVHVHTCKVIHIHFLYIWNVEVKEKVSGCFLFSLLLMTTSNECRLLIIN